MKYYKKKINKIKNILIVYIILLFIILFIIILNIVYVLFKSKDDKFMDYNIVLNTNEIYLSINESFKIESNIDNVDFISLDNSVAVVDNGIITGIGKGETIIQVKIFNTFEEVKVSVSDLYTVDVLNEEKEYLKCNQYTKEENNYLDKVLEYKINNVGYKTRAAAVEAARFLTLEFKYKIPYFYENGRLLTNGVRSYVDGEGRYYHKGLYLSEDKFNSIVATEYGPVIWGCPLYTKILNITIPNGLDCSGFVSWVLLNAGFDVGDAGAGISEEKINDLDDLGTKLKINSENISKVRVGDLLSRDGHIGMLIGIDNDNFYIAESLNDDLHVLTYDNQELLDSNWVYFIDLDSLYNNDGNLTNMW